MIVGTTRIDSERLRSITTVTQLQAFATELVPPLFRHVKEIVDNQKYLVALQLRDLQKHDYNAWHSLCEGLLEDVHITGGVHTLTTCQDLLRECDIEVLNLFLKKEGQA